MRALVTGATGFVGQRLLSMLDHPVVLSRDAHRAQERLQDFKVTAFGWDPTREPAPAAAFEGVDAVFHLAGESIADGRWTAAKKQRLRDSRVLGTQNLVATLDRLSSKPQVLISASAIGYYGDRGDQTLSESDSAGQGFLADLCVEWEREAQQARSHGIRVVNPRIGIVLGTGGGALSAMLPVFRYGAASPLGNGRQWMSWIHVEDLVRLLMFAAEDDAVQGPLNATAPHPVTNREFTKTLAGVLHRPAFLPALPRFALRLVVGEFADALLQSQRVVPASAERAGFHFRYPDLQGALQHLLA